MRGTVISVSTTLPCVSDEATLTLPNSVSSSIRFAMSVVDDTLSMPTSRKMRRFFGLLTRAIQRGTLNTRWAISHDTRLSSSWPVVATNTSALRMPASSWYFESHPSPWITR